MFRRLLDLQTHEGSLRSLPPFLVELWPLMIDHAANDSIEVPGHQAIECAFADLSRVDLRGASYVADTTGQSIARRLAGGNIRPRVTR